MNTYCGANCDECIQKEKCDGCNFCYGVVADSTFILICSYSVNGSEPELILYRKR